MSEPTDPIAQAIGKLQRMHDRRGIGGGERKVLALAMDALRAQRTEGRPQSDDRIRLLERAVGNCFMMAKREIARHVNGKAPSDPKGLERWQHVQRFCETTGSKSDILRGQLPDEITEGSGSDRPDSERP